MEDVLWQLLSCCGPTVFYAQNCQSYKAFWEIASNGMLLWIGIVIILFIIYL